MMHNSTVMPAHAGIQLFFIVGFERSWTPDLAGVTGKAGDRPCQETFDAA